MTETSGEAFEKLVAPMVSGPIACAPKENATKGHTQVAFVPTPPAVMMEPEMPVPGVTPSECKTCQDGPSLVYALGQLSYDFESEARRDSFRQYGLKDPYNPLEMLKHLKSNPSHATALTWTLVQETLPIYAIMPMGPFGAEVYATLQDFLTAQSKGGVERVSIPGWSKGSTVLMSGQTVPLVVPEHRGMYSWTLDALVSAGSEGEGAPEVQADVKNFLQRIYHETRNLGSTPQERAINYAASDASQPKAVFFEALSNGLKLRDIRVERSPICNPGSDCLDVKLTFFNPMRRLEQALEAFRFTIDVTDVIPVTVGEVRRWQEY